MIYFIRAAAGPVKIGLTNDPAFRLAQLQTSSWDELRVMRTLDGARAEERWLHTRYAPRRLRGEWFSYCPTMETIEVPENLPQQAPKRPTEGNAARVVSLFGGIRPMADKTGIPATTISHWKNVSGFVSARYCAVVVAAASEHDIDLSAADLIGAA